MTATSTAPSGTHHGWQATNRPHRPGAPVGFLLPTTNQISGVFAGFCATMSSALKAVY